MRMLLAHQNFLFLLHKIQPLLSLSLQTWTHNSVYGKGKKKYISMLHYDKDNNNASEHYSRARNIKENMQVVDFFY